MKRVAALVEGQTEEETVTRVLGPHLWDIGLDIRATRVVTRETQNQRTHRGGMTTFERVERDLKRLLSSFDHVTTVTTFFDLYALPSDFPGMPTVAGCRGRAKAQHLEAGLAAHFESPKLLPFIALHEFEGLLFTAPDQIAAVACDIELQQASARELSAIRERYPCPEDINDSEKTAPSKRILAIVPAYRKRVHGPEIFARIGLKAMRECCPHFDAWLRRLESLGGP